MTTRTRCGWASTPLSIAYHDKEWGVPVHDDRVLFEFLMLEGAQAGLSWETILKKRDAYRKAFAGFDPAKVARFTPARVERLLAEPGHRPQPAEDREHGQQRQGVSRGAARVRQLRCVRVGDSSAARRVVNAGARMQRRAGAHAGVGCAEPRPLEARLQVRRLDDLLRLHAGGRDGRRPHGRLLSGTRRSRRSTNPSAEERSHYSGRKHDRHALRGSSPCRTRRPSAARARAGRARRTTASGR